MNWRSVAFLALLIFPTFISHAQGPVLTFDDFISEVARNHPLARQAENFNRIAIADLLESRGAFDPELYGKATAKRFDGTNYYRTLEAGISYQSPFALRAKVGFEEASGTFLNPMEKVPEAGQLKTELTLPLGKGLLMDEARANRKKAMIGLDLARSEQLSLLNELLAMAGYAYWDWIYAEEQRRIYEQVASLARIRFDAVRYSFENGAKPALDTLEANIQMRNRENQLEQALLEEQRARLILGNFRWDPAGIPSNTPFESPVRSEWPQPDADFLIGDTTIFANRVGQHPDIRQLAFELDQVRVEERLKLEYLKPKADLSFAVLGEGWRFAGKGDGADIPLILEDFHVWNISVGFPLFLRTARGGLQANRVKQQQLDLKIDQKQLELMNKARQYQFQMLQWNTLYAQQRQIASEYKLLWEAETEKFNLGKGSLFLINARESQWIEAELKAAKFFTEIFKSYIQRQLSLGILANEYLDQ